jgi:hypothetical protein
MTDIGVCALGAGCSQLQKIDLSYCNQVSDFGVSALGAGCSQLQVVDLLGCEKVTREGISRATWVLCGGKPPTVSR